MQNFSPKVLKMWILEPFQFWVADSKNQEFENFTKEKLRFLTFLSPPKINRSSDLNQLFLKLTTKDIPLKSVIIRILSLSQFVSKFTYLLIGGCITPENVFLKHTELINCWFLRNPWTDLSQILNLGWDDIVWSPYKFSGQSEHLPACKRVKHEHSCFKVDSFCVLESKIPFFDFLFIPPWKITNSTCMHLLLGYTSKKSWSPKRVFSEAIQLLRPGVQSVFSQATRLSPLE